MASITGTVTRVLPATGNFFILPSAPRSLSSTDVDGHRCGIGEISANLLNARVAKIARYPLPLPAVGDVVTLDLIDPNVQPIASTGPLAEEYGDGS